MEGDDSVAKAMEAMRRRRRGVIFAAVSVGLGVVGWALGVSFPSVIVEIGVAFIAALVSLGVALAYFSGE